MSDVHLIAVSCVVLSWLAVIVNLLILKEYMAVKEGITEQVQHYNDLLEGYPGDSA